MLAAESRVPENAVMKASLPLPALPTLPHTARCWLMYSGGLDSTVLLHHAAQAQWPRLHALHVHHGLQPAADGWARQCRVQCKAFGVSFKLIKVRVDAAAGEGMEAAARRARYDAIRKLLKAGDLVITAHHRDDQAETVLMRLLRGSGIAGMAAMQPLSAFPPAQLWRPLLEVPRTALQAYAQRHGLDWVEDPHNENPRYARSYVRKQVMPALAAHWPQAQEALTRFARHASEAQGLLTELAADDLRTLSRSDDSRKENLSCAALLALSPARRANVLRHWITQQGFEAPSADTLQRLETEVLHARPDATPLLHVGAYDFRRYRDTLYLMPPLPPTPPKGWEAAWHGATLALPAGCGTLKTRKKFVSPLTVRFARGGERIRLAGHARSHSLKNLFQQAGVPPWQRQRLPLIYLEHELLCVSGHWATEQGVTLGIRYQQDF